MPEADSGGVRAAGFVCDPIDSLNIAKDTSVAMMHALIRKGWAVSCIDPDRLFLEAGQLCGHTRGVGMDAKARAPVRRSEIELCPAQVQTLENFDLVLMRVDPPVDARYLKITWLLDFLDDRVPVFNPPRCLRALNEKLTALRFPEAAETLVSGDIDQLLRFAEARESIVVKPLNAMGGKNVYRFSRRDSNLNVLLEDLLAREHLLIAQVYIPAIEHEGDKRIIVIDGQVLEVALARLPRAGDHRGNLAAGAQGSLHTLSGAEQKTAGRIAAWLCTQRIPFAGLDMIGDRLTEINITSPTCVREMENLGVAGISDRIVEAVIRFSRSERPASANTGCRIPDPDL